MRIVPGEMLIKCRTQCFLVAWIRLATVKKGLKNKFQSLLIHSSHGPLRTQRAVGNNQGLRPKGPEVYYQICHLLAVGFFSEFFNFSEPQFTCMSNMDVKAKWSYKGEIWAFLWLPAPSPLSGASVFHPSVISHLSNTVLGRSGHLHSCVKKVHCLGFLSPWNFMFPAAVWTLGLGNFRVSVLVGIAGGSGSVSEETEVAEV